MLSKISEADMLPFFCYSVFLGYFIPKWSHAFSLSTLPVMGRMWYAFMLYEKLFINPNFGSTGTHYPVNHITQTLH